MCLDQSAFNRARNGRMSNNLGNAEEARRLLSGNTPKHTKYAVVNLNTSKTRRNSFDHNVISSTDANSNGVIQQGDATNGVLQQGEMTKVAGSLREMAATIVKNAQKEQSTRQLKAEWQAVTKVLDRLFFYSYILAIVFSLSFMFPRPE